MYLHLGGETVVKTSEVVAILNMENIALSSPAHIFLKDAVSTQSEDDAQQSPSKSLIITDKCIYISPISSFTLMKRAGYFSELSKMD